MLQLSRGLLRRVSDLFALPLVAFGKRLAITALFCLLCGAASAYGAELNNGTVKLTLGLTPGGVPLIERAEWVATGEPIFVAPTTMDTLDLWVPDKFIPSQLPPVSWRVKSGYTFHRGEVTRELLNGMQATWIVELANGGSTFRLRVRLKNSSGAPLGVKWFPIWNGEWQMGDGAQSVRWWRALSYGQNSSPLTADESLMFGSRLHSSNFLDEGAYPYWVVSGGASRTYFALEWCGGWEALVKGGNGNTGILNFNVRLPQAETELTLTPGESVEGPALWVTPTNGLDEARSRSAWMAERSALGQALYGGPAPSFPLTYNTWNTVFSELTRKFLKKQIAQMGAYDFDAFIVDAGWYEKPGQWQAKRSKFQPGELEGMLAGVQAQGVLPGIWSAPQYTSLDILESAALVEVPGFYNDIADGYLIDLAGGDFKTQLKNHVASLRSQFSVGWWKYDQEFFVANSRSGVMKNVIALQKALSSVRRANPDLMIESCLNGGRMINEFTALTSQALWLRDGQKQGLEHALQNIEITLEATEFLFPWLAYRFTKNFDVLPPDDAELTKLYCRSAMIGIWGVSTDLRAIPEQQRDVILREMRFYRFLAPVKLDHLYDIDKPAAGKQTAGITYYDSGQRRAWALLYRWDSDRAFTHRLVMTQLDPNRMYRVRDVDLRTRVLQSGAELMTNGIEIPFTAARRSALLYVEAIETTEEPAPDGASGQ